MTRYITQIESVGMLLRINELIYDEGEESTNVLLMRKKSLVGFKLEDDEISVIAISGKIASFYAPFKSDNNDAAGSRECTVMFSDKVYGPEDINDLLNDLCIIFANPNQVVTKQKQK